MSIVEAGVASVISHSKGSLQTESSGSQCNTLFTVCVLQITHKLLCGFPELMQHLSLHIFLPLYIFYASTQCSVARGMYRFCPVRPCVHPCVCPKMLARYLAEYLTNFHQTYIKNALKVKVEGRGGIAYAGPSLHRRRHTVLDVSC